MSSYRTELGQVIFNPETRSYETVVTFHEGSETNAFACSLRFPTDMPMEKVAAALVRQAKEKRQHTRVHVTSLLGDQDNVVVLSEHRRRPVAPHLRRTA